MMMMMQQLQEQRYLFAEPNSTQGATENAGAENSARSKT